MSGNERVYFERITCIGRVKMGCHQHLSQGKGCIKIANCCSVAFHVHVGDPRSNQ